MKKQSMFKLALALAMLTLSVPAFAQDNYDGIIAIPAPDEPFNHPGFFDDKLRVPAADETTPETPAASMPEPEGSASASTQAETSAPAPASAKASDAKKSHWVIAASGSYNQMDLEYNGKSNGYGATGGAAWYKTLKNGDAFGVSAGVNYYSQSYEYKRNDMEKYDIEAEASGASVYIAPVYRLGDKVKYTEYVLSLDIPIHEKFAVKADGKDAEDDYGSEIVFAAEINARYKYIGGGLGMSFAGNLPFAASLRGYVPIVKDVEFVPSAAYVFRLGGSLFSGFDWDGFILSGGVMVSF